MTPRLKPNPISLETAVMQRDARNSPQPKTGAPLSSEDVVLLRRGDVVRWPNSTEIEVIDRLGSHGVIFLKSARAIGYKGGYFTFIGRPDADGWIPAPEGGWGENPVPGMRVEARLRFGEQASVLSDLADWRHRPRIRSGAGDIIAIRLPDHISSAGEKVEPANGEVSKQRDEAVRIATRLHETVESLIYGLPKYLNDTAQTDEENMIGKAWHVFDAAAYGLAALPKPVTEEPANGEVAAAVEGGELADRIVEAIWSDICGRKGFDLSDLDDEIQDEIRAEWKSAILRAQPNGGAK